MPMDTNFRFFSTKELQDRLGYSDEDINPADGFVYSNSTKTAAEIAAYNLKNPDGPKYIVNPMQNSKDGGTSANNTLYIVPVNIDSNNDGQYGAEELKGVNISTDYGTY